MRTLFVATAGVETAPLSSGSVVYNLKTGKFIMLNRSANRIWSALGQPLPEEDLVDSLRTSYPGLDATAAQRAVADTVGELRRLELVGERSDEGQITASAARGETRAVDAEEYAVPAVKVLDEEDLLKVFQITAAEISVASCWWGACTAGCP